MQKLSEEKIEILIETIKKNPYMYNKTDKRYKHTELKEILWQEIANDLKIEVNDCKTAWKSLRDQYVKFLKDNKTVSGQAFKTKKPYKFSASLEFLRDSMQPRETTSNYASEELENIFDSNEFQYNDDSFLEQPTSSRKRRREESDADQKTHEEYSKFLTELLELNKKSERKGVHSFFDGLADVVASVNMPPVELLNFQSKVQRYCSQLIEEFERKKDNYIL